MWNTAQKKKINKFNRQKKFNHLSLTITHITFKKKKRYVRTQITAKNLIE